MKSSLKVSLGMAAKPAASTALTGVSKAEELTLCWAACDLVRHGRLLNHGLDVRESAVRLWDAPAHTAALRWGM
jgi:hypothetical protein